MHELSIALSLVDAAEEELRQHAGARVQTVYLKLGLLSGVVRDALEFSYEAACNGTPLEGSRLVIEEVPVMIDCPQCAGPREIVSLQQFQCAVCGSLGKIVQGRELQLSALEIAD